MLSVTVSMEDFDDQNLPNGTKGFSLTFLINLPPEDSA